MGPGWGMNTIFAEPYSSWEKGNQRGQEDDPPLFSDADELRDTYPTGSSGHCGREGNVPMKVLDLKTPAEYFNKELTRLKLKNPKKVAILNRIQEYKTYDCTSMNLEHKRSYLIV